jgi:hypothetical protein
MCGKRPAAVIPLERNVGMLVVRVVHRENGPFCREHGIAKAQEYLRLSFLLGWWGILSFFVNFILIGQNVRGLNAAKRLPAASADEPLAASHA